MKITRLHIAIALGVCAMHFVGFLASSAPWLARENIFEFTARDPKNKTPVELDTPPDSGPAAQIGGSSALI